MSTDSLSDLQNKNNNNIFGKEASQLAEEERQILLASQMRNIILGIFEKASFLTERLVNMFAERERLAASMIDRKRLMCVELFNEHDEIHQSQERNSSSASPSLLSSDQWKNTSSITTQTEGNVQMVTSSSNPTNGNDEENQNNQNQTTTSSHSAATAAASPNSKKLQSSDENDPDVEKTVQLLTSIRDLLRKKYLEEQKRQNILLLGDEKTEKEKENAEDEEEPGHIGILRQLGFDVSQFDTSPLNSAKHALEQERLKKQERRERMQRKQEEADKVAKSGNIWAQASKIVISSSDDDENDRGDDHSLIKNRKRGAESSFRRQQQQQQNQNQKENTSQEENAGLGPLARPIYNKDPDERRRSTAAAAGRSRVLALVSALQFQATAAALGEREAQRRNFIMLEAFHGGWECYKKALDEISDRSLFTDYVAAKRNHEIVVSPGRRRDGYPNLPSSGVNNNNQPQFIHNQFGIYSPTPTTPPHPPAASSSKPSSSSTLDEQQQHQHHQPDNSSTMVMMNMMNENDNDRQKRLALYKSRKSSPTSTSNPSQRESPSSSIPLTTTRRKSSVSSPVRPPHQKFTSNNSSFGTSSPIIIPNNNNDNNNGGSGAGGGFLEAWKSAQNTRPGDFKGQLEALKREIARRPTPTRASTAARNGAQSSYMNEVPSMPSISEDVSTRMMKRTSTPRQQRGKSSSPSPKTHGDNNNIRRDSQGKIILTPSPSATRNRRKSLAEELGEEFERQHEAAEQELLAERNSLKRRTSTSTPTLQKRRSSAVSYLKSDNDDEDDYDDDLERRMQQKKNYSPSYSAQQRAAARKHQQIFDADDVKKQTKKIDDRDKKLSKAVVSSRNNRIASFHHGDDEDEDEDDEVLAKIKKQRQQYQQQLGVGGWMQISDGDVRLTWTRRFLRWEPNGRRVFSSAREGVIGKAIFELADPEEHRHIVDRINVREHHAQIVSPFHLKEYVEKKKKQAQSSFGIVSSSSSAPSSTGSQQPPKFYLLNVSQDHFYGNRKSSFSSNNNGGGATGFVLLEPPDPAKHSKNGVTLTMQSYHEPGVLATVVLCAETQVHAVMWVSALKHMQIEAELC